MIIDYPTISGDPVGLFSEGSALFGLSLPFLSALLLSLHRSSICFHSLVNKLQLALRKRSQVREVEWLHHPLTFAPELVPIEPAFCLCVTT
jgi:hypothetical protein